IKAGRTYMPIRFLGYAMGLTDDDIVWDEATQKVTMTKGEKVVELTVGSTTITVNGEAKTMDVAPEITGGRTMLPARYVAEGLGYVVGWDAGTQTVLISK
ncbi:MAG: copper amine oxidase N-terminal domain-containing protein, partial [Methylocystaceae bacterium]